MKGKATRQERRGRPSRSTLYLSDPTVESLERRRDPEGAGPILAGGDVDADCQRAASSGEEAVGGRVATPDQDVVDEVGEALGVLEAPDAEVRTSEEILRDRDRHYWDLDRKAGGEGHST